MAFTLSNMGLRAWDQPTDHFAYTELVTNWTKIDQHDHTTGKGVQIPSGGIADLAVTLQKLADLSVGTAKVQDGAITLPKIAAAVITAIAPPGMVVAFSSSSIPSAFLLCDGQAVSRTTYAALFAAIGTMYGVGNGTTTFNVPDYRGRVLVGLGTHGEVDALTDNDGIAVGSRKIKHNHSNTLSVASAATGITSAASGGHTHTTQTAGSHTHTIDVPGFAGASHPGGDGSMAVWPSGAPNTGSDWLTAKSAGGHTHTVDAVANHSHALTDPGHAHSLLGLVGDGTGPSEGSAYHVVNYIIKT
jgi:microcystin-dependent protein